MEDALHTTYNKAYMFINYLDCIYYVYVYNFVDVRHELAASEYIKGRWVAVRFECQLARVHSQMPGALKLGGAHLPHLTYQLPEAGLAIKAEPGPAHCLFGLNWGGRPTAYALLTISNLNMCSNFIIWFSSQLHIICKFFCCVF